MLKKSSQQVNSSRDKGGAASHYASGGGGLGQQPSFIQSSFNSNNVATTQGNSFR